MSQMQANGATIKTLATAFATSVAIVDSTGVQISSFGGGTQYAEGNTAATATGTLAMWKSGTTLTAVATATPMPVAVTGNVTVVQPTGTNLHVITDSGTITTVSAVTAVTAITNALPAGTNTIGGVINNASATATGLTSSKTDAQSTTVTAVKASAGRVYGYHIYNSNTADAFFHFYDIASGSVTVGTSARLETLWIPAGGAIDTTFPLPLTFATAISTAATTTIAGAGSPTTGLLADIFYI